ncbi:hypothetical protein Q8A67_000939 [Cirrhinus molitorella]|uniref:Uncharacterized protein n=1 Tax=Cirrhinus molitorella TaxID=172907 RepID=A0AA88QKX5_9TELE|nr:hypothetical protein Q8A67_000939 [Cirrhinus molitorella]
MAKKGDNAEKLLLFGVDGTGVRLAPPRSALIGLQISRTLTRGNLNFTQKGIWGEPLITFFEEIISYGSDQRP